MNTWLKITAAVIVPVMAAAALTAGFLHKRINNRILPEKDFASIETQGADVIYFLNTGSSDAILLQSDGHFAMIDAGEDNDNPRNFPELEYKGYEDEILEFLKRTAGDDSGKVHLDFILGTHSHSDHIGGFDTIVSDESIGVEKAYLKEYRSENIRQMELDEWDNQEVYDQMVEALNKKAVPIISDISAEPFQFGNLTVTFLNTEYDAGSNIGENDNSVAVLVEKGGKKALLAADLDNCSGDEERIAALTGKVDLLKVGHHSYAKSTQAAFLKIVSPELSVVTNSFAHSDKFTLARIAVLTKSRITFTEDAGGVAAIFGNGEIFYVNHIGL